MTTILVGPESQAREIAGRAYALGLKAHKARFISNGVIRAESVTEWVGVEPVGDGWVNLRAPDAKEGDVPGEWLHFASDDGETMHANTLDLVAIRVLAEDEKAGAE